MGVNAPEIKARGRKIPFFLLDGLGRSCIFSSSRPFLSQTRSWSVWSGGRVRQLSRLSLSLSLFRLALVLAFPLALSFLSLRKGQGGAGKHNEIEGKGARGEEWARRGRNGGTLTTDGRTAGTGCGRSRIGLKRERKRGEGKRRRDTEAEQCTHPCIRGHTHSSRGRENQETTGRKGGGRWANMEF